VVGKSETDAPPVRCLWIATGNNPSLSSEMSRRTVTIRLDAKMPKPYLRTEFKHENLRKWVRMNHGKLVWAALTIVRAWVAAGRPQGTQPLGQFESYCEVIGGILDVVGVEGFLEDQGEQAELVHDSGLAQLVHAWKENTHSRM
jgi:putative DNA primase/helicase